MSDPSEPDLVSGRYSLVRELGRGGSAIVYLATDKRLGGSVAVKVLHESLSASGFADRFRREIRLMADFGHANIIPIIDSGVWNQRLFYVMKYVESSETLRERMVRQPSGLPVDDVLEMARGLCGALAYAHARNVFHRDVKPENILLTGRHAYLTDFGVAKAIIPMSDDGSVTSSGFAIGTPRYMSPEQEVADATLDSRTDIWSLSCVIFEALSGLHPFNSPDASRTRSMKFADRPEPLRRHRPEVPQWLEQVVERGLKPNPADRWQSVEEFAFALRRPSVFGDVEVERDYVGGRFSSSSNAIAPANMPDRNSGISRGDDRSTVTSRVTKPGVGVAAGVLAVATVGATFGWFAWNARNHSVEAGTVATDGHVIAVAVTASSANPELSTLADRLNADVVDELSQVPMFRVVPTAMTDACRKKETAACSAMLQQRGVETRLDATVERVGDSLQLHVELIDEKAKTTIPSLSISAPAATDAKGVHRIATRLATVFRQRLGAYSSHSALLLAGAANNESNALLRAIARERADAESLATLPGAVEQHIAFESLARADSLFGRLIGTYPHNAQLWIERGWVALAMSRRESTQRDAMLARAAAFADTAFRYQPGAPKAYELRGLVRAAMAEAMENGAAASIQTECSAEDDLRRAVAGDEKLFRSWSALSTLVWTAGRTDEAKLFVRHAMDYDSYYETARDGLLNIFFVQLLLENYDDARQVCLSGHDLWKSDYKFFECQLTLMLYDAATPHSTKSARWLVEQSNRLDPVEKARAVGDEYRAVYRDAVLGIVAARNADSTTARALLAKARQQVANSSSATIRYDFSPQEATLVWELGDRKAARAILVDWLKHRPDEVPNFRRDPTFRRMHLRDEVLREAGLPLTTQPSCGRT